jgi:hypothetical protein
MPCFGERCAKVKQGMESLQMTPSGRQIALTRLLDGRT